jgi:ribosomal protein L14
VRERVWNQAAKRKTGVEMVFGVNAAVTVRERVENTGSGVCGGVPSAPASVKALRPLRGALKDARP